MPPRPPNFLPANRRRRLDPSRRLRSRELWNRVRYLSSSSNNNKAYTKALLHAVAYECQPFPILPTLHHVLSFVRGGGGSSDSNSNNSSTETTTGLARLLSTTSFITFIKLSTHIFNIATIITSFIITNRVILYKTCITLIALIMYHRALLYLHDLLAIGPLVIIITLLTVLYTVGLGDNTGAADSGIPSAYSVFNKGMARLLGTIDGEELARQYAGGGGGGGAAAAAAAEATTRGDGFVARLNNNNDDEVWEEWIDEEEIVNERRRHRRLERLRRREHEDNANDDSNNANDDEDYEFDDAREDDQRQESAAAAAVAARKKSGKKSRRKDLDLRREMQQQRRVAAAMGFGVGDELAAEDIREIEARFALLE